MFLNIESVKTEDADELGHLTWKTATPGQPRRSLTTTRNRGTGTFGERPLSHNPIVQDFVPSSGWTEDYNGYYLRVHLPDFKKEEVKFQVDTNGVVTISGERLTSDNIYRLRFQQTLKVPPVSDINRITGKFDRGILDVTVPRLTHGQLLEQEMEKETTNSIVQEHNKQHQTRNRSDGEGSHVGKEEKKEKNSRVDDFPEEVIKKWEKEQQPASLLIRSMRLLKENKPIVFTALLAFSLGVLVSRVKYSINSYKLGISCCNSLDQMENVRETRGLRQRTISDHNPEVREIVPSSGWTEDSNAHYLLLRLPDFKTEEVKLDVDKSGHLTVSGERVQTVSGDKFKIFMFEQTFNLPQNSDIDQILGKVEDDILIITVPKRLLEDHENVNDITEETYIQETIDYVANKHGGGGGYRLEMDENSQKNSWIDSFPREVVVALMAVLALAVLVYRMFYLPDMNTVGSGV
ncbi:hypothetical protein ACOSP7_024392 [Xanthoceras sorbifolium]